jgi:hypothetical protein
MPRGSVLVDIAIDQGGCFETSKETTHTDPVYTVHDVVHYAVGNIPGAVPNTSTYGLTNATLPYVWRHRRSRGAGALSRHPELVGGVSVVGGALTNRRWPTASGASSWIRWWRSPVEPAMTDELGRQIDEFLAALAVERGFLAGDRRCLPQGPDPVPAASVGGSRPWPRSTSFVTSLSDLAPTTVARKVAALRGLPPLPRRRGAAGGRPVRSRRRPPRPDAIPKALDVDVHPAGDRTRTSDPGRGTGPGHARGAVRHRGACQRSGRARLGGSTSMRQPRSHRQGKQAADGSARGQAVETLSPAGWSGSSSDLPKDDAVFLNLRGRRLTRQTVFDIVKKRPRAGLDPSEVSPHVLGTAPPPT